MYDGPLYRALRRRRDAGTLPSSVVVKIVSAKYGLIGDTTKIATYDQRLDPSRDRAMLLRARSELSQLLARRKPRSICVSLGKDYAQALPTFDVDVVATDGPPGARVRQVLDWIEQV